MANTPIVRRLRTVASALADDKRGATVIEYALIAMLIALAIVGVLPTIAPTINTTFNTISGKL